MEQTIVPYLPQLMHSVTHQLTPPTALLQTESLLAPNRGAPLETEPSQRQVVEARAASLTPMPTPSQSRSYDLVQTGPNFDSLSPEDTPAVAEEEGGQEKGLLNAPNLIKSHSERRDKRRYCRFHSEYDHDTEECRDLQYQIEDLIRRGHLSQYVHDQSSLPNT
ncbi:hypothetical protein B296_00006194 [Ensete ventricosum]|uniref:Uncharacterized protein n=1 Tax=Ensete ventricosum TaxID=4639 RepID=A0A427APC5_ENSVE|nr:hypothetical protein B296_00006194 [Ensete ventricosum]